MPRRTRTDAPGLIHHVTNRGVNRQDIFFDDSDRRSFGEAIDAAHEATGIRVLAYCLMDNHIHLLLRCDEAVLSQSMQIIGFRHAQATNLRHGRDGHLFGSRFFNVVVDSGAYQLAALRYIERNPLDINGVESPFDYRWSSARANAGMKTGPDWLASDEVRSWFTSPLGYLQFVGDEPVDVVPGTIDVHHLAAMAKTIASLHADPRMSQSQLDRTVFVLIAERLGPAARAAVHRSLGLESRRSIREALRRATARSANNPSVEAVVERTMSWLCDGRAFQLATGA